MHLILVPFIRTSVKRQKRNISGGQPPLCNHYSLNFMACGRVNSRFNIWSRLWRKTSLDRIKNRMNTLDTLEGFATRLREGMLWQPDFNALALELFKLQFELNPAYRRFCESRNVDRNEPGHWSEIPAVPAAAFKELELSCIAPDERSVVFFSSGTTEHRPSRHFHNEHSLDVYEASLLAGFKTHFLPTTTPKSADDSPPISTLPSVGSGSAIPTDAGQQSLGNPFTRALALTPNRDQAPNSSLVYMFDALRRSLNFKRFVFAGRTTNAGTWELDALYSTDILKACIDDNEAVLLLGTAFSYVHLLDYLEQRKLSLRLPKASRVLETGGYKGRSRSMPKSELHSLITKRLGVPASQIVSEYGMSELSSQAYDWLAGPEERRVNSEIDIDERSIARSFHFPRWARTQIISPETGREVEERGIGLIRVFDLANVYSVMAIQTEDLAIRRGDGFELIGRSALAEPRGCSMNLEKTSFASP